ncbi:type II toxin-antitoxin system RelE family toxin [Sphaerospermopsis torques-reginae]|uniref:type II toxin-antitoxin system RelE family toxin n=1 Tax=Sphaerospermopsis torques-reginae TaxID=984207 RepID=UPI001FEC7B43|nr:hypothetical protein [Sphaerospermopsis torques-reginae]
MQYQIEFKPKAIKDLQKIPVNERERIINKIEAMQDDLQGDVKRLTNGQANSLSKYNQRNPD